MFWCGFATKKQTTTKVCFESCVFSSLNFSIENCLFYASFTIPVSHWSLNIIAYINFSMSEPNLHFTVFCFSFGNLLKFMKTNEVDSIEHTSIQNCFFSKIWIWAPFKRTTQPNSYYGDSTVQSYNKNVQQSTISQPKRKK